MAHSSRSKRAALRPPSHPLSPGIKHPRGAGAEGVFPYPREYRLPAHERGNGELLDPRPRCTNYRHYGAYFSVFLNKPLRKALHLGLSLPYTVDMSSTRPHLKRVTTVGAVLGVFALGSLGLYTAEGSSTPNASAATAHALHPDSSALASTGPAASASESPSAEPTPETVAQQMDRVAQEAFGAEGAHPVGETQKPFTASPDAADVTVQQYQGGVVMHTTAHGAVAMHSGVYSHWWKQREYSDFAGLEGLPTGWRSENGIIYTTFEKAELYWDTAMNVPRSTAVLGTQDALVIGDSQVLPTSWVGLGLSGAGFTSHMFRCGGVGFVASRPGTCPSYYQGVIESVWALPGGTPGVIYLDASGNDMYVNEDEMKATEQTQDRQTRVIQQLQRMYPSSKIVLGGVVSMSESAAPDPQKAHKRHTANEAAKVVAQHTGVLFMDTSDWLTLYLAEGDMADSLHLKDETQYKMAAPFAARMRELLAS